MAKPPGLPPRPFCLGKKKKKAAREGSVYSCSDESRNQWSVLCESCGNHRNYRPENGRTESPRHSGYFHGVLFRRTARGRLKSLRTSQPENDHTEETPKHHEKTCAQVVRR